MCILDIKSKAPKIKVKFRDFSLRNTQILTNNIILEKTKFLQTTYLLDDSVNVKANKITTWLKSLVKKYCPIKIKHISQQRFEEPWITTRLAHLIRKQSKMCILFARHMIPHRMLSAYSRLLAILLDKVEKKYHKNKLKTTRYNEKEKWKCMNNLII